MIIFINLYIHIESSTPICIRGKHRLTGVSSMDSTQIINLISKDTIALQNQFKESDIQFLKPELCVVKDVNDIDTELWIIYKKDEYCITYNEPQHRYGLAFKNIFQELVSLAEYNSLPDAYEDLVNRDE